MKILILLVSILVSASAQADVIICYFERAQPAMRTIYNTDTGVLTYQFRQGGEVSHPNMSLQIMGAGKFEIWNRYNELMMRMRLNYEGKDGKSFKVYPYTAIMDNYVDDFGDHYRLRGGCSSSFLPAQ